VRSVTAEAALSAVGRDVQHISSCTPLPDVMAMRHEQADLRLFAT
jgi:urease accessory protein UreF